MTASWVRQRATDRAAHIHDNVPDLCDFFENYDKNGSNAGTGIASYIITVILSEQVTHE